MNELRKNHIVQILTKRGESIDGIVFDYADDRVMILISYDSLELAKNIKELDELSVIVNTHLGIKKMKSFVLTELNANNCIIIENNESEPVVQKREHVRVISNMIFNVVKNDSKFMCFCVNISAGGIAFISHEGNFELNQDVVLNFPKEEFGKEIVTCATIIKRNGNNFVAKYRNINPFDEDKLVKYVFKMISKK